MSPYMLKMPHWPTLSGPEPQGTPSERVRLLLTKLGHPEQRLPPVVHVGGTKGKGSTIAFLRAMLEAAGYRVHSYTSPHLNRFNERIVLAGEEIGDAQLHEVLEITRVAAGDMPVGFFDATTAAAMIAFAEVKADVLLMEMGLGGSVDATNLLDAPYLTLLTTVSYDHMEFMGTTLPEIAAFEAGLLKPNVPCVVSFQHHLVAPVIEKTAETLEAPLYSYGKHWFVRRDPQGMVYGDAHGEATLPSPSLHGAHQLVNAGNAMAALSAMTDFHVSPEHIVQGLTKAQWKGRLERIQTQLLSPQCELWFDGGHNLASAQAVSLYVQEHWQDKPFYLIFGATQGKDVPSLLAPFVPLCTRIYGVKVKSEPKSHTPQSIRDSVATLAEVIPSVSIEDALRDIMLQERGAFRALVFGSLYLWLETSLLP